MIKLSIVTPTFNRAHKLERNLDSVLSQTDNKIEHIIIDNLSDDDTPKIVEAYKKKASYPVIYIRKRDSGPYNAMNKGIKRARGEWIHILNSDDAYYSEKSIEYIVDKKNDQYDLLCGSIVVDKGDKGMITWYPSYDEKINHYNFPHPGTVIKKFFYEAHGLYDERFRIVSDGIFGARNYSKARYALFDEILVIMDHGGLSSQKSWRNSYEYLYHLFVYHKFPLQKFL